MRASVTMLTAFLLLASAAAGAESASPISAIPISTDQRRDDQMHAWQARRSGRGVSLRDIERRVVPQVPNAQYLGADYDADEAVYTLKFVRDGQVIWVEVDGGSGQVVGRSGR